TTPTFTGFPLGVTSGTYDHTFDTLSASSYNPAYVTAHGGTAAGAEAALAACLSAGGAYLNIHSTVDPGGEIRGFLTPDNDLALTNIPANITVNATSPAGATVSYAPPTVVDEDSPLPTVNCLPASGSTFPIGQTTVHCTATATGDLKSPATASFSVTVNGAGGQLQALLSAVTGVGPGSSLADKVTAIQGFVAASDTADACGTLAAFINE